MKRWKKIAEALGICLLLAAFLSACGVSTETEFVENGCYRIELPADWNEAFADETRQIYESPAGDALLTVIFEVGGYNYYSPDDLAENLGGMLAAVAEDMEKLLILLVWGEPHLLPESRVGLLFLT